MDPWQRTQELAPGFVGLPLEAASRRAEELGLVLRLVDLDACGGRFALTADLREDRVTVLVQGGVVTTSEPG